MKLFFIVLLSIISIASLSQTKLIAFKSHSGQMENFKIALNNELFDNAESNFGIPSFVNSFRLDSVIYISPSVSIVVQTVFTRRFGQPEDSAHAKETQRKKVRNEPLFANKHLLDSIKNILVTRNRYGKAAANLVLIGFDNTILKQKKNKALTGAVKTEKKETNLQAMVAGTPTYSPSYPVFFDATMAWLVAGVLLLSLLCSWCCWKFFQPALQRA